MIYDKTILKDFLGNYPVHKQLVLNEDFSYIPECFIRRKDFIGQTFDYFCEIEKETKTFELELSYLDNQNYGKISGENYPELSLTHLDYTFYPTGVCKSCGKFKVEFLINVRASHNRVEQADLHRRPAGSEENCTLSIVKYGESIQRKIKPDPAITKSLSREAGTWYFKAINCMNEGYGIGAFGYMRRIIELELLSIIESIKELPDAHEAEINKLLEAHNENPSISTIYSNIFEHLPSSLKGLGDNPIKLLYNQTSEGLHSMSEEECMKRAETIRKLLDFVIVKINSEKSDIKEVKDAIKSLK